MTPERMGQIAAHLAKLDTWNMRHQGRDFEALLLEAHELVAGVDVLWAERDTPEVDDFLKGVALETVHQRKRWGRDGDAGKAPADWFWLVGYLAGKALHAVVGGNVEKSKHHLITTAAALCNWHAAILGKTDMCPGIEEP